ncbi:tRNA lysidine(34) synthetase TilS [Gilvimarinus agarilyticus]|uniref:tRNA lysidine(34) synthetase TilS n=1 Tax=Gilvimarinus agarilyticus TaxID=679259 RepID=UPI000AFE4B65|nr:tRNA lysidine(34) synthetase TilS [Gilvimarinus agarilyticus]
MALAAHLPHAVLQASEAGCCWVGFSGGLDSTALLHWVVQQRPAWPVRAVHVNHGLSHNAEHWQRQCEQQCQALGVELTVITPDLKADAGNVEARAREARYQAFNQCLAPADVLLLAHHQDDQAETVLYRLLRGAGAKGLSGMAASRELGGAQLHRPLLQVTRAELEAYAREQGLTWVEDESNQDVRFDRNYLRQQVLPVLRQRWPAVTRSLADAANLLRRSDALLIEYAAEDVSRLGSTAEPAGFSLPLIELAAMSEPRRHNVLRYWLERHFAELPSRNALAQIDTQLMLGHGGSHQAEVVVGQVSLQCFNGRLMALSVPLQWQPAPGEPVIVWSDTAAALPLPGGDSLQWRPATGAGIAAHWLGDTVTVAWRCGGERCQPAGRAHSQQLKKLLQEYQVPVWLRSRVPLIYIAGELAVVGDYWVCQRFAASGAESGWALCWQWPDIQRR